jgi:predicted site-specific integrase-resolvase
MQTQEMLTPAQVADMLRVPRETLRYWRKNGKGPPWTRLSDQVIRYPREAFEKWLSSKTSDHSDFQS